ncbi:acyltransferase [Streptomyces solincola]|uniref:Acyltransferase n=1 Tax=Streptomyces solincola TaxID=2100817 RepID=A0A2S9Q1F5_9ACTN|nr:acyltransferase [Streptomyces solincola]PRH80501.1 acyltransferase [Streptomyces solincola]
MTAARPPIRQLPSLTGYRAVLFVAVFLTHTLGAGQFYADADINALGTILPYGTSALSTFFVLSGFVLTWGEPWRSTVRNFWWRRVLKIYPGHVITWAGTLLMLWVIGPMMLMGSLAETSTGPVVANLFLVQAWIPDLSYLFSVYGVNWSVSCEIAFYLLLPLLIRPILRIRAERLWLWLGVAAATLVAIPTATHLFLAGPVWDYWAPLSFWQAFLTYFFPLTRLPEFLMGVLLARIVQTGRWSPKVNVWWIGLLVAGLWALLDVLPATFRSSGLLTLGIALLVPLIAARDLADKPSWLDSKPMVLLGNASYAAYLVHFPLLGLARYLTGETKQFGFWGATLIVVVLFVVTQAVGLAMFVGLERPLMRKFGRPRWSLAASTAPDPAKTAVPDPAAAAPAAAPAAAAAAGAGVTAAAAARR